jgi:hypothetical protein
MSAQTHHGVNVLGFDASLSFIISKLFDFGDIK